MLCAIIAGNAKLGMSIEANNIFQSSIATVSFKPDVILRRLAERADAWSKEPESIKKWSGYVKMMEFLPWFEYMSSVRVLISWRLSFWFRYDHRNEREERPYLADASHLHLISKTRADACGVELS